MEKKEESLHPIIDREQRWNSSKNLFQWSDEESNDKDLFVSHRTDLSSTTKHRLLYSPGDIFGQMDLLNGRQHTETCQCITNTLVRKNLFIFFFERRD